MSNFFDIEETAKKIGLPQSRLRYIEARFPAVINRRLFDPDARFYSAHHLKMFKHLDYLIHHDEHCLADYIRQQHSAQQTGKILVFASGKGGVGKTSLSVNLAVLAASLQFKAVFIDGDLGMADAHALLGIQPRKSILNLFSEGLSIEEIMIETHSGLKFIPGGCGLFDLANLDERSLTLLAEEIELLRRQFEWLIIDSQAGIGKPVLSWIGAADELIVVTTPSSTALLDAYGLIKTCTIKNYTVPVKILVNMVGSQAEGLRTFQSLNQCTKKFLNKELRYIGAVHKDSKFEKALAARKPLTVYKQKSLALRNLYKISQDIFKK